MLSFFVIVVVFEFCLLLREILPGEIKIPTYNSRRSPVF